MTQKGPQVKSSCSFETLLYTYMAAWCYTPEGPLQMEVAFFPNFLHLQIHKALRPRKAGQCVRRILANYQEVHMELQSIRPRSTYSPWWQPNILLHTTPKSIASLPTVLCYVEVTQRGQRISPDRSVALMNTFMEEVIFSGKVAPTTAFPPPPPVHLVYGRRGVMKCARSFTSRYKRNSGSERDGVDGRGGEGTVRRKWSWQNKWITGTFCTF